jgi:hypothetical protein
MPINKCFPLKKAKIICLQDLLRDEEILFLAKRKEISDRLSDLRCSPEDLISYWLLFLTTEEEKYYVYKELELILSNAPINFDPVENKLDAASISEIQSTEVNNAVLNFLKTNTAQAKAFGDWIVKVHKETLKGCLEAIKESGISLPDTVNLYVGINININR